MTSYLPLTCLLPASRQPWPGCGFPAWRGSLPAVPVPLEPAEAPRGGSHYVSGAYCSRTEVLTQDHGSPPTTPAYVRRQTFRGRQDSTITGIR